MAIFLNTGNELIIKGAKVKDDALDEYNKYNTIEKRLHEDEFNEQWSIGNGYIEDGMDYISQGFIIFIIFIVGTVICGYLYRKSRKKTIDYKSELIEEE